MCIFLKILNSYKPIVLFTYDMLWAKISGKKNEAKKKTDKTKQIENY